MAQVCYWIFVLSDFCWGRIVVCFDLICNGMVRRSEIGCDGVVCIDLCYVTCRIGGFGYRCVCQTISLNERVGCYHRSDVVIVLVGVFRCRRWSLQCGCFRHLEN